MIEGNHFFVIATNLQILAEKISIFLLEYVVFGEYKTFLIIIIRHSATFTNKPCKISLSVGGKHIPFSAVLSKRHLLTPNRIAPSLFALAQHEEHRLLCLYPSKNGNKVWKVTVEGSNDAEQTAEEIQQQAEVQTPEEEPKPKANILVHYSYCLLKITCKNIFFCTKLPQFEIFVVTLYHCFILVLN